jgi:hypothetical protein
VPFGSFVAVLSGLFFSSENRFVTVSWLRLFCVSASAAAAFAGGLQRVFATPTRRRSTCKSHMSHTFVSA